MKMLSMIVNLCTGPCEGRRWRAMPWRSAVAARRPHFGGSGMGILTNGGGIQWRRSAKGTISHSHFAHETVFCYTVRHLFYTPFTWYNWFSTGCQTSCTTRLTIVLNEELFVQPVVKPGCTTGLTTGCIHDTAGCQTSCQTGLTTSWMFVYTIQPVVKRVWQQVVSCKRGFIGRPLVGMLKLILC